MIRNIAQFVVAGLAAGSLASQSLCEGTGVPGAYIRSSPAMIGGRVSADIGSPTQPNGFAFLCVSLGLGPTSAPLVGPVCLDVHSPIYTILTFGLDPSGNAHWSPTVPNVPGIFTFAPFFMHAATFEAGGFSIARTVRLGFELPDSYDPLAVSNQRALHTATPLYQTPLDRRQDVLIAGGATGTIIAPVPTASTELFSAVDRTLRAGPSLSLPRSGHRAVLLLDGRVLIAGGATTGDVGTATCDLYDPVTNAITPAASMSAPRMCLGLTVLADGRVLASGGFADWSNAGANFVARLNTVQNTTEIYDPATDTWTAGPVMASPRAGHSQTTLLDGRLLLVGGVNGGASTQPWFNTTVDAPTFTNSCEYFDPTTSTLAPAPPIAGGWIGGRGYHGASLMPNGGVLVTGGAATGSNNVAVCAQDCQLFNGTAWVAAGFLPVGVAFHSQVTDPASGNAVIMGGFTGDFGFNPASTQAGVHNGTAFTATRDLGGHAYLTGQASTPRAGHTCTPLPDGTFLVWGGQTPVPVNSTIATYGDGYAYVK